MGVGWVLRREDVSDEIEGVGNWNVLSFSGIEVQLPIFGLFKTCNNV